MKHRLNEETFGDAIKNHQSSVKINDVAEYEDAINADDVAIIDADQDGEVEQEELSDLEKILDKAAKKNERALRRAQKTGKEPDQYINVLVEGPAGVGKTSIVKQWAKSRGYRLLTKSAMEIDMGDLGGVVAIDVDDKYKDDKNYQSEKAIRKAKRYSLNEFDELGEFIDGKYCVLFLDEFNRASGAVRASLLTLINNHVISDTDVQGGKRFLPAFLFTVAAVNPTKYADYIEPFDPAELGRFYKTVKNYDPQGHLRWLKKEWREKIKDCQEENDLEGLAEAKGQIAIAERLLNHPSFHYADPQEEEAAAAAETGFLNPRSLTMLLDFCDGTKADFIENFPGFCGPTQLPMIKQIMSSYQDVDISDIVNQRGTGTSLDNKANSVFKQKSATMSKLDNWESQNL